MNQALFARNNARADQTGNVFFKGLRAFGHRFAHGVFHAKNIAFFDQFRHQLGIEQHLASGHAPFIHGAQQTLRNHRRQA